MGETRGIESFPAGAWARRPSHTETLSDRRVTAVRKRPLDVTRFDDTTVFDHLLAVRLISPRQHDAARVAHVMLLAAGLVPRVVGRIDTIDDVPVETFEQEREREAHAPDSPTPRDRYRAIMRRLGGVHAGHIEAMLLGDVPTRSRMPDLVVALDKLADLLGTR